MLPHQILPQKLLVATLIGKDALEADAIQIFQPQLVRPNKTFLEKLLLHDCMPPLMSATILLAREIAPTRAIAMVLCLEPREVPHLTTAELLIGIQKGGKDPAASKSNALAPR